MTQDFGSESGYWQDFGKKSRYPLKFFLFLFGFSIMAQLKAFPSAPPKTPDLTSLGNCNAGFASKIPRAPGLMRLTITSDTLGTFSIQSKLKTFVFSPVRFQTYIYICIYIYLFIYLFPSSFMLVCVGSVCFELDRELNNSAHSHTVGWRSFKPLRFCVKRVSVSYREIRLKSYW